MYVCLCVAMCVHMHLRTCSYMSIVIYLCVHNDNNIMHCLSAE